MEIVVADLFQLQRVNGKFSKEHKILSHPSQKVTKNYVDEINENSHESGKFYVINVEATKKNKADREEHLKALELEDEASKISAKDLLGAISKGVKAEKKAKQKEVESDEGGEETPEAKTGTRRAKDPSLD
jgi:hypothetical protein